MAIRRANDIQEVEISQNRFSATIYTLDECKNCKMQKIENFDPKKLFSA